MDLAENKIQQRSVGCKKLKDGLCVNSWKLVFIMTLLTEYQIPVENIPVENKQDKWPIQPEYEAEMMDDLTAFGD